MLYKEILAVCPEIHIKHINTLCGQNVEFVNVKPGGSHSNHWDLNHKCSKVGPTANNIFWLQHTRQVLSCVCTVFPHHSHAIHKHLINVEMQSIFATTYVLINDNLIFRNEWKFFQ
jgi:hypothetical protein